MTRSANARARWAAPGLAAVLACALPAPAPGQPVSTLPTAPAPRLTVLAPGITHERVIRDGRQIVHVVRARASARTSLIPVAAAGSTAARGSLTDALASRRDTHGAVAGVNGDFFNFTTGNPSGVLLLDGALIKEPEPSRSALIVRGDGSLDAAGLSLVGRWQAIDPTGARRFAVRTFQGINRSAQRPAEAILYNAAYGQQRTPQGSSISEVRVRLDEDRPIVPGAPLTGVVIDAGSGGGMTIGAGHVVLAGVGSSGRTLARDVVPGLRIEITPGLVGLPDMTAVDPSLVHAVGGGPLLVRDGRPVTNAGEGFTAAQTGSRTARTAVGQRADGTVLLVTAEGFVQGSPGITTAEQATLMAGLGARVAVAMDSGGSAQMALGTRRVVNWGPSPRSLSNIVALQYRGLLMDEMPPRISPNADRVDDTARVIVRAPEAGRVTVRIVHRTGRPLRALWAGQLAGSSATVIVDPRRLRLPDGIYNVVSRLEPESGGPMQQSRRLIVDRTLGGLVARPSGRGARQRLTVAFRLQRPARVDVLVRNSAGTVVARLAGNRPMRAGRNGVIWNRRISGRPAAGRYRVEVIARGPLGRTGLVREVRLSAR